MPLVQVVGTVRLYEGDHPQSMSPVVASGTQGAWVVPGISPVIPISRPPKP